MFSDKFMGCVYVHPGTVILYINIFIYITAWDRVLSFMEPYVGVGTYLVIV